MCFFMVMELEVYTNAEGAIRSAQKVKGEHGGFVKGWLAEFRGTDIAPNDQVCAGGRECAHCDGKEDVGADSFAVGVIVALNGSIKFVVGGFQSSGCDGGGIQCLGISGSKGGLGHGGDGFLVDAFLLDGDQGHGNQQCRPHDGKRLDVAHLVFAHVGFVLDVGIGMVQELSHANGVPGREGNRGVEILIGGFPCLNAVGTSWQGISTHSAHQCRVEANDGIAGRDGEFQPCGWGLGPERGGGQQKKGEE